jgi:hypothetical protein
MQINREEALQAMKEAYEKAYIDHKPTSTTIAPHTLSIDWFPPTEKLMEAALDALVRYLPDANPLYWQRNRQLYQELKSWGKK